MAVYLNGQGVQKLKVAAVLANDYGLAHKLVPDSVCLPQGKRPSKGNCVAGCGVKTPLPLWWIKWQELVMWLLPIWGEKVRLMLIMLHDRRSLHIGESCANGHTVGYRISTVLFAVWCTASFWQDHYWNLCRLVGLKWLFSRWRYVASICRADWASLGMWWAELSLTGRYFFHHGQWLSWWWGVA